MFCLLCQVSQRAVQLRFVSSSDWRNSSTENILWNFEACCEFVELIVSFVGFSLNFKEIFERTDKPNKTIYKTLPIETWKFGRETSVQ